MTCLIYLHNSTPLPSFSFPLYPSSSSFPSSLSSSLFSSLSWSFLLIVFLFFFFFPPFPFLLLISLRFSLLYFFLSSPSSFYPSSLFYRGLHLQECLPSYFSFSFPFSPLFFSLAFLPSSLLLNFLRRSSLFSIL